MTKTENGTAPAGPGLMTLDQVAARLGPGISRRTVENWHERQLLRVRRIGRRVYVTEADFAEFCAEHLADTSSRG